LILNDLTITNFGLYRGSHSINLKPQEDKPIILFGGMNGAGKTTLLEAISLCFFGKRYFGNLTQKEYIQFLNERFHDHKGTVSTDMSVEITFSYIRSGEEIIYKINRNWQRQASDRINEEFFIMENSVIKQDLINENWDDFIQEIIPFGVSRLFFFDGEKIKQLANDESDNAALQDSIHNLLNIHLIDRLSGDLKTIEKNEKKSNLETNQKDKLISLEEEIKKVQEELKALSEKKVDLKEQNVEFIKEKEKLENELLGFGSDVATKRIELTKENEYLKKQVETTKLKLRELSSGVLPFLVIKPLLERILEQSKKLKKLKDNEIKKEILQSCKEQILKRLVSEKETLTSDLDILNSIVSDEVDIIIKTLSTANDLPAALSISDNDLLQLQKYHHQICECEKIHSELQDIIETCSTKIEHNNRTIRSMPDEEYTLPIIEQLNECVKNISINGYELNKHDQQIRSLQFMIEQFDREWDKTYNSLTENFYHDMFFDNIDKSISILDTFKKDLIKHKVTELETNLVEYITTIARKEDLVKQIYIDTDTFEVTLLDEFNNQVPKKRLSAGEKQIYAISMLWALAKTSGRNLPVIIDTPLGRLDSKHRNKIVSNYFPNASKQVILFSTDTEIDQSYFKLLTSNISHSYQIKYEKPEGASHIEEGYFWEEHEYVTH
jgi:DNA sulfur modification protein DndD